MNMVVKAFPVVLAATITLSVAGSAWAYTSVDELKDVPSGGWASQAVKNLEQKNVVSGYPDGTFKGQQSGTRNEMAVLLNALANVLSRDLARMDKDKASTEEVEMLSKLHKELRSEVANINTNVGEVNGRINYLQTKNAEEDKRLTLLEKTQVHGDITFGALYDTSSGGVGTGARGIEDGVSTIGRVRLTLDVPVVEDREDSMLGAGVFHTRLIGAWGRYAPRGSNQGGTGSANYPFNLYSRVSADVSSGNEGLGSGSVGSLYNQNGNTIMLRPNVYIETAFYSQHLKAGIPFLTNFGLNDKGKDWQASGDLYVGLARWWDFFDVSPYRGNELTQFQNNSFINIPGIAVNITQPMIAYAWHQGLGKSASLDLTSALGGFDQNDFYNGMNLSYEAKLNYTTAFLGPEHNKPGSLYLGGYNIFQAGTRTLGFLLNSISQNNRAGTSDTALLTRDTVSQSAYAGWNQEWWRGIGTNVGYVLNQNSPNVIIATTMQPGPALVAAGARQSLTSVLSIPMSAFVTGKREKDVIGVGYSLTDIFERGITAPFKQSFEHVVEGYYKYQLTENFAVIPSVQFIVNRLGIAANDLTTVFSLRMSHSF